jgi:Dolichyl-phosphate-mannose-protein mannosyltransferase
LAGTQITPDAAASGRVATAPDRIVWAPGGAAGAAAAGRRVTTRHASRRQAWRWALLVAAGWVVQFGLRVCLSRAQTVPLANPDESAYLIAARVLAGGPATDFSDSTLYQGGYPLLITPVFWFTSNPVTAYHAVLVLNAAVSAGLMPLAYLAGRRLGLSRLSAYLVAAVTALLPAGVFYAEYAMADAIYPVLVLAWLLATHSWLTARSVRGRYAAAAGSALLAGYGYAVHSRGMVIVAAYVAVGILVAWRRLAPRGTVAAAALALAAAGGASRALDRYLSSAMYPEGTRDLTAQMKTTLHSVHGAINVLEMAAGQLWRLVLDSWGLAGIGLVAAAAVVISRRARPDLRIMAAVAVAVTVVTACTVPAALPPDQSQIWASGRYLDEMIVVLFLVGAAVLVRAGARTILGCAVGAAALTVLAAVVVAVYAGSSLPTAEFSFAFNFAEPAVLTQDWTSASVWLATAVTLGLLGTWVLVALAARRWHAVALAEVVRVSGLLRVTGAVGLAAVSVAAVAQMTSQISHAATAAQAPDTTGFVAASALRPGDRIAVAFNVGVQPGPYDVSFGLWAPQAFEVWWNELEFFDITQAPPAGVNVVEAGWPPGQPARTSWPQAPAGWRIVASSQAGGWVTWRKA